MKDFEYEIHEYRKRLQAEAELAASDLDELEDHLRELTIELQTAGRPAAEAITEAARRLGDPRQLAREHARVRSPFGAPLRPGRAVSAALLFVMPLIAWLIVGFGGLPDVSFRAWLELGTSAVIAIALAARITWARAVVVGLTAYGLTLAFTMPVPPPPLHFVLELGLLAFVVPWGRKEVSAAAISLALQVWVFSSASTVLSFSAMAPDGALLVASKCATIAVVAAAAGCIGSVLRARWNAIASTVGALALFGALADLSTSRFNETLPWQLYMFTAISTGAIAAVTAAILGWRATRSGAGTFRHVIR